MKTLVMVLAMAGAALAQTKAVKPQDPPSGRSSPTYKPKAKAGPEVTIRGGTELGWDDNILDLNDAQMADLQSGGGNYRIAQPGDFVYSAWAQIRVKGKVLFADPAAAGIKVQPYFYASNPLANFEEYKAFLQQDFGAHRLGIEYGLERDVYHRERDYVDSNFVSGSASAFYDDHEIALYWEHAFPHGLSIKPVAGWRIRDYNAAFDFRDRDGFFAGLEGAVELGKGWKALVGYEWTGQEAGPTAFNPIDTSFQQHQVEIGGELEVPGGLVELSLRYRVALRDFTSAIGSDLSHLGRTDFRHRVVLLARFKVAKGWAIDARYEFRFVDSDQPNDPNPLGPDAGDSLRNVFLVGLTVSL
jgi:hypothetical protein